MLDDYTISHSGGESIHHRVVVGVREYLKDGFTNYESMWIRFLLRSLR